MGSKPGPCALPKWRLTQVEDELTATLATKTGVSPTVARILASRGVESEEAVRRFLEPSLARDWLDPTEIPGMEAAARRVADAVERGESILVFGDFDLDGISSAAVAARGLTSLGAKARATIPNRFTEGYGLTETSVARIRSMKPDLVITVDCGVASSGEVAELRDDGIDVVVTDHHEPGDSVPDGIPVANPKLVADHPSRGLAGAGVALKLVQLVGRLLGDDEGWLELTDLATLGTVADIVPLVGENRALVAHGLEAMRTNTRLPIAALASVAGVDCGEMSADSIAFNLAPRMNAAGRMADPEVALGLLMTDDPAQAEELAHSLDEFNRLRQSVEQDLTEAATALAEREFSPGDRAIVLAGEGWHEGVKGIVASRLARRFSVPAILFAVEDGEARGSGRSVGDVDLYDAVSACSDLTLRFGGHEAAVGVTIRPDDVPGFRARLLERLGELPAESFVVQEVVEGVVDLEEVSLELAEEIERLAPFGHENRKPLLAANRVFLNGRQRVGRNSDHLRFTAYDGVVSLPGIAFRCRDIEQMAGHEAAVDLAFEVSADVWRGKSRIQLMVREMCIHEGGEPGASAELVDDLFARADEIIAREEYSGIEDAESFHTKLVGVTFEGRQEILTELAVGSPLRMVRQPDNEYDANAVAIFDSGGSQVGFLNRRLASVLARVLDAGVEYDVEVTDVTGGEEGRSLGVNILVTRRGDAADEEDIHTALERRESLASLDADALGSELLAEFIGAHSLHEAQRQALEVLDGGGSCLTVMATGRGKSLIFQMHACKIAIRDNALSVFVYPLRALVADQAYYLEDVLGRLGLRVVVLTGETSPSGRDEVFESARVGDVDVILTTPEFLDHHAVRFAATGRVGFLVVDEAHHVASARAGHRPAYGRLGEAAAALGTTSILAVTATASDDTADAITSSLGIDTVITDPTTRENLMLVDKRTGGVKDDYLAALASKGEKMIIYVNSREQSVRLARMLRKRVPDIAYRVAFYNGGLGREARHAVEGAFRRGEVQVVVATSAFGEGVNIPDIRHVALYHLPFNDIEFNQMCGRSGRDGATARVHVLFGEKDGKINEMILSSVAPGRDDMAALYRVLGESTGDSEGWIEATNAELAESAKRRAKGCTLNDRGVSSALGVFRELGFVEAEGYGPYRRLRVLPRPNEKVELSTSVRYSEGLQEIDEFDEFRKWALSADADELLARFNRPILPTRV